MQDIAELHPLVVHFPIAILILYILVEVVSVFINNEKLKFTAQFLLIAGVISALAAVLSGNQAEQIASKIIEKHNLTSAQKALEAHEEQATFFLWYFVFVLVIRTMFILKKKFNGFRKIFVSILAVIGLYLILNTGKYGGELVYKYGVGTNSFNEKINE